MIVRTSLLASLAFASLPALADWSVAPESVVTFQTSKNTNIIETHRFKKVSGSVTDSGAAMVSIDLSSIDSGIEIRDQRMKSMLFNTGTFTTANFQAMLPKGTLAKLEEGHSETFKLSGSLSLHGERKSLSTDVIATPAQDGKLVVSTLSPIMLSASDFSLTSGIESLRQVAGLNAISTTVPVNFTLVLNP